jgi:hypothetical protein
MEKKPQNLQNHAKVDPAYHYFLLPVGLFLLLAAIYNVYQNPGASSIVHLVAGVWAVVAVLKIRVYSLKVQDRVIRLEERLRLQRILPEALSARTAELTEGQLIAIRFASDDEVPTLVEKCLAGHLAPKAIKQTIQTWRPDYWRV